VERSAGANAGVPLKKGKKSSQEGNNDDSDSIRH